METPAFDETDLDRSHIVPAAGLEAAARTFARIITADTWSRDTLIGFAGPGL